MRAALNPGTPEGVDRGSMIVVTLMLLLALTSVGMVALHLTSTELGASGNTRRGVTAFRVTEAGAYSALAYAHSLGPDAFIQDLESTKGIDGKSRWSPEHIVTGLAFFDMGSRGSFGYEGYLLQLASLGEKPADFEVVITATGMRQPLVGYSATGPTARCRFKYRFESTGNVGDQLSDEPANAAYAVWQKITTETYIGPLPCEGRATATGSL